MRKEGRAKKRRRRERDLPTKGDAKKKLIDQGVGFWTKHAGEWCVRIAGDFRPGSHVRVMANAGRIATVVLGDPIPGTRFQWMNSAGELVSGQLFRRMTTATRARLIAEFRAQKGAA
jgi:hypothetical protein